MPEAKPGPSPYWRIRVSAAVRRRIGRTGDSRRVARLFGLRAGRERVWDDMTLEIVPGQLVAVVGPSGAGKSVLLRRVVRRTARAVVLRADGPARSGRSALEFVGGGPLERRLEVLSRCGLAEAAALVRPARELSAGQQWRLALAKALHGARRRGQPALVVADEFASGLDATTAAVLARQVRTLVRTGRPSAPALLLATPRAELLGSLRPDRTVVKPLAEPPRVLRGWRAAAPSTEPPWASTSSLTMDSPIPAPPWRRERDFSPR
jgi:ABC-type ATPase with predicted acetyltransferase domain